MTKKQWQDLYDDLYYINHQVTKLFYDVHENTNISKKQTAESKKKMIDFMSTAYYKIKYNQEALELFEQNKNINDLKLPDHFEWNITPFLHDIDKHIKSLQ